MADVLATMRVVEKIYSKAESGKQKTETDGNQP